VLAFALVFTLEEVLALVALERASVSLVARSCECLELESCDLRPCAPTPAMVPESAAG